MKKFIAYFDYLGFKDFIEKNEVEHVTEIMNFNFRDIEYALGGNNTKFVQKRLVTDTLHSSINCLNFSDTVIFWTQDESSKSFKELLEVVYRFNNRCIHLSFPVRGALVYGEIISVDFRQPNNNGSAYNINSVYGKGLVASYIKAESQNWAGTVIDQSVLDVIDKWGPDAPLYIDEYAKRYKVPYKEGLILKDKQDEYVFFINKGKFTQESYNNISARIADNFAAHKKDVSCLRTQHKLKNTLDFLKSCITSE